MGFLMVECKHTSGHYIINDTNKEKEGLFVQHKELLIHKGKTMSSRQGKTMPTQGTIDP
jgi:hypothetical protein